MTATLVAMGGFSALRHSYVGFVTGGWLLNVHIGTATTLSSVVGHIACRAARRSFGGGGAGKLAADGPRACCELQGAESAVMSAVSAAHLDG